MDDLDHSFSFLHANSYVSIYIFPFEGSKLLLENGPLHWVSHPGYKTQGYLHVYVILPRMTPPRGKTYYLPRRGRMIIFDMAPSYMHGDMLKASRPLFRVLVINDNGLWINDFI